MKILKKLFDYDEKEIVTIRDYLECAKKHKIYIYHLGFLVFVYGLIIGVQAVTGEWDIVRNIVILLVYIFLEYINILVWRRNICQTRYRERKDKKFFEGECVEDG